MYTCEQHFACFALNACDVKRCGLHADAERKVVKVVVVVNGVPVSSAPVSHNLVRRFRYSAPQPFISSLRNKYYTLCNTFQDGD